MPFPRDVRELALVAAARHCCVCHRYKGIKLEVHHLIPEAAGGRSTIDNAIALCFDCHTDAGHYNPRHPRGTKYSQAELIRARDTWFATVQKGGIANPGEASPVHARYLICKTWELLTEICNGDLSRVPAEQPVLAKNPVLQFMASVIAVQAASYRHARAWGDRYSREADYLNRYPDARRASKSDPAEAYYNLTREPSADDMRHVAQEDGVSGLLSQEGIPRDEIVRVFTYEDICGGVAVQEVFRLRPFWGVFFAATNVTSEPLYLDAIEGHYEFGGAALYRRLGKSPADYGLSRLPGAALAPGATALIPVATLLAPHQPAAEDVIRQADEYIEREYVQSVSRVHLVYDQVSLINTWGPVLRPQTLLVRRHSSREPIKVHELDLGNVFVVNRHWEMGSCPHVFIIRVDGDVSYAGELLASKPAIWHSDAITLPPHTSYAVIAELEEEVTELLRAEQDGVVLAANITLHQGMKVILPALSGSHVIVKGRYRTRSGKRGVRDPSRRGDLVGCALRTLQSDVSSLLRSKAVVA